VRSHIREKLGFKAVELGEDWGRIRHTRKDGGETVTCCLK